MSGIGVFSHDARGDEDRLRPVRRDAGGGERILSRPAIELMTRDHLTPEQKAASPFFENFWDTYGWGFGLGVVLCDNIETIREFIERLTGTELFSAEIYFLTQVPAKMDWHETLAVVIMSLVLFMADMRLSLQAVKAVEIGDGMTQAGQRGSVAHDAIAALRLPLGVLVVRAWSPLAGGPESSAGDDDGAAWLELEGDPPEDGLLPALTDGAFALFAGRVEAVLGIIEARDRQELTSALGQLAGGVAGPLHRLRDELLDLLADVEAGLDGLLALFPA